LFETKHSVSDCRCFISGAVASALWALVARSPLLAEDSVSYKYENYSETGNRMTVRAQSMLAQQDLGTDTHFQVNGVIDAIAGASPNGLPAPAGSAQVPLTELHDRRKAWEGDLSHQFDGVNISAGFAESREHDYISRGWSLNTLWDFNQKNTTLLVGVAGHSDDVEVFYDVHHPYVAKQSDEGIAGITQLLDPLTTVTVNLSWGRETGYLADQYKLVEKSVAIAPGILLPMSFAESRPGMRDHGLLFASIDRSFPGLKGSLEVSYRYHADTYGIGSHTIEATWFQHVGSSVVVEPNLRFYVQDAARFYHYDLDTTTLVPTFIPNPSAPAYSSDYRLSSMLTDTAGLKVVWTATGWLQLDVAYSRYDMRGRDGTTPQSAYPKANILTGGAKVSW